MSMVDNPTVVTSKYEQIQCSSSSNLKRSPIFPSLCLEGEERNSIRFRGPKREDPRRA